MTINIKQEINKTTQFIKHLLKLIWIQHTFAVKLPAERETLNRYFFHSTKSRIQNIYISTACLIIQVQTYTKIYQK